MSIIPALLSYNISPAIKASYLVWSGIRMGVSYAEHSSPEWYSRIQKVKRVIVNSELFASIGSIFYYIQFAYPGETFFNLFDTVRFSVYTSLGLGFSFLLCDALNKRLVNKKELQIGQMEYGTEPSLKRNIGDFNSGLQGSSLIALITHITCMTLFGVTSLHIVGAVLSAITVINYFKQKWLQCKFSFNNPDNSLLLEKISFSYLVPIIPYKGKDECPVCYDNTDKTKPLSYFCRNHGYHYSCLVDSMKTKTSSVFNRIINLFNSNQVTRTYDAKSKYIVYVIPDIDDWQIQCPNGRCPPIKVLPQIKIEDSIYDKTMIFVRFV